MLPEKAKDLVLSGSADRFIKDLLGIGEDDLEGYKDRLVSAIDSFASLYGEERDVAVFSVGGRSELSGNHTDHNGGKVIAAAINLDIIAVASARDDGVVRVKSEGFDEDVVPPEAVNEPDPDKYSTSAALIAGIEHAYRARGLSVGGFDAYTTSNVIKGSGLSSSAAFEVMIGKILSYFYNMNNVDTIEIAKSAQYAENVFFGKPCGLMDQIACASGGLITVDFSSPADPAVRNIDFDFSSSGLSLCITNTGSSHVDLTDEYAAVPAEMKQIASFFGKDRLCEIARSDVEGNITALRKEFGDRAVMRALHFFCENVRVEKQAACLENNDAPSFLALVKESGLSSFCYLQNVYSASDVKDQGTSLALCVSDTFLKDRGGASRIQGGGFAGTIEAFVPNEYAGEYKKVIENIFGEGSCHVLNVRRAGAVKII